VTVRIARIASPFGDLIAASTDEGLMRLAFPVEGDEQVFAELAERVSPELQEAPADPRLAKELAGYFAGRVKRFTAKLDRRLIAGGFQRSVLEETATIPYGRTESYIAVAAAAGSPRGSRAAGNALGANPLPIVIPCHRVVRSCGALGGYGGGLEIKRGLLALEGAL
jgi:methylated-DNA-[protein]-cysteine S-methyltransferase